MKRKKKMKSPKSKILYRLSLSYKNEDGDYERGPGMAVFKAKSKKFVGSASVGPEYGKKLRKFLKQAANEEATVYFTLFEYKARKEIEDEDDDEEEEEPEEMEDEENADDEEGTDGNEPEEEDEELD